MCRVSLVFCILIATLELHAEHPIKGYSTQLTLDAVNAGPDQTLTGRGAPEGAGIYVELWRVAPDSAVAQSVASVHAISGEFSFAGVDVQEGEQYYVTLSRSWQFDVDGDVGGWDQVVQDATLNVLGGTLNVTIEGLDPHFFNLFEYNADYYRVIEVRLRNPNPKAPGPPYQDLGIYWGDFGTQVNLHFSEIPTQQAAGFETVYIPMNVGEAVVLPGPVQFEMDGLWATGLHDSLRLDPLDSVDPAFIGTVFQIDYIRIREDFRLDFDSADDLAGLGGANVNEMIVAGGYLSFQVPGTADPSLFFRLASGKLESGYFPNFVIGMDNSVADASSSLRVLFNDDDSGSTFVDDGGNLQVAEFAGSVSGRQDLVMVMDLHTAPEGEWSEDGRAPVQGLQLDLPGTATAGDQIRVDYLGFVPENPFGPSNSVFIPYPNNAPVAVIDSDPPASSPVELELQNGVASAVLDGSRSHDGDDGTQELSFWWDGEGGMVIDQPDEATIEVTFTEPGEYLCRLTVSDGELTDSATQVIVVKSEANSALERLIEKVERYVEKLQAALEAKLEELAGSTSKKQSKKLKRKIRALERRIKMANRIMDRLTRKLEKKQKAKSC